MGVARRVSSGKRSDRSASTASSGCLTKDHDLGEVADAIRDIVSGRDPCPSELALAMAHDKSPGQPRLSAQERRLLRAYAADMTLEAAARRSGIRPATAEHYLERMKQKYRSAGRPTYTKLDLAARVREDGLLRYPLAGQQGQAAHGGRSG
jgi:DNA-binding NarL/FixJ family response regulator